MTADELISTLEENESTVIDGIPYCVIDPDDRTIAVPESEKFFGVTNDKDVERRYFICPKVVGDNIDLSQHQIYVAYAYASNETTIPKISDGLYNCEDVEVSGDNITFSWKLSDNVFTNAGFIVFKVMAKKMDSNILKTKWNTLPAYGTVLMTLPDGTQIESQYPDILTQILDRLDILEQGSGSGINNGVVYNAVEHGLSVNNNGLQNSQALQSLIDEASIDGGGIIYIPSGQYKFASNGTQTMGQHCIKMKSNVSIIGNGSSTVLMPTGTVADGLDMFYYNDYVDNNSPVYLENCIFRDFTIDGTNQHCTNYTSAGKGFMLNLIKNCHWDNVTVRNMDATGFGIDCTVGCTIRNCTANNNGKGASTTSPGASGFGIGFGYSYDESILIDGCLAVGNKKFGYFFEHQRRFSPQLYNATSNYGFLVSNCIGRDNYYNFGGIQAINVDYINCMSCNSLQHGYFFQNSEQCHAKSCISNLESNTSFVILADYTDGGTQENKDNAYLGCISKYTLYGVKVVNSGSTASMQRNIIKDCFFNQSQTNSVLTSGNMDSLILEGNVSNEAENSFSANVTNFVNKGNSWNT